jgi:leucyl aminopeptidase
LIDVEATTSAPPDTDADTIAVGLVEGESIAHDLEGGPLQALVDSGEARPSLRKLAVTHAEGRRWLLVGLGRREELDAERARVAGAVAQARASELGARILCWEVPHHVDDDVAAGLVTGTVLGSYRFDRYKARGEGEEPEPRLERLLVSAHHDTAEAVRAAAVVAHAQNAARDLQNTPANDMTPTTLGERARELASELEGLTADVEGRDEIEARGMGSFASVTHGSDEEPALITMRYEGPDARGPVLGFVGKGITFDTGGISIKPSAKMAEMKFDMSGAAAVIEAMGAVARLRLPVNVVAVVGASENMPSGHATRPGDIVRSMDGITIEVNNTDAEGRLVLADCLAHARAQGAERLIDLATLTGAILIALGSTYAGMFANDDGWARRVEEAAEASGEEVWRLPLHPEYAEMIKGRYGDIANVTEDRKAGSITAAQFLERFSGGLPWVHLDIAGTAWDRNRPYAGKEGSGFGVRLLVELARASAADHR